MWCCSVGDGLKRYPMDIYRIGAVSLGMAGALPGVVRCGAL